MPVKSKAQLRFLFHAESTGELPKGTAKKWIRHTPDMKALPEKVSSQLNTQPVIAKKKDKIPMATKSICPFAKAGAQVAAQSLLDAILASPTPQQKAAEDQAVRELLGDLALCLKGAGSPVDKLVGVLPPALMGKVAEISRRLAVGADTAGAGREISPQSPPAGPRTAGLDAAQAKAAIMQLVQSLPAGLYTAGPRGYPPGPATHKAAVSLPPMGAAKPSPGGSARDIIAKPALDPRNNANELTPQVGGALAGTALLSPGALGLALYGRNATGLPAGMQRASLRAVDDTGNLAEGLFNNINRGWANSTGTSGTATPRTAPPQPASTLPAAMGFMGPDARRQAEAGLSGGLGGDYNEETGAFMPSSTGKPPITTLLTDWARRLQPPAPVGTAKPTPGLDPLGDLLGGGTPAPPGVAKGAMAVQTQQLPPRNGGWQPMYPNGGMYPTMPTYPQPAPQQPAPAKPSTVAQPAPEAKLPKSPLSLPKPAMSKAPALPGPSGRSAVNPIEQMGALDMSGKSVDGNSSASVRKLGAEAFGHRLALLANGC